jgi:WD40 repeat protein
VKSVAFSADGTRIVSGSHDNTMRVWDANTGASLSELTGHSSAVTFVAFSVDDTRIVSRTYNQCFVWCLTPTGYTRHHPSAQKLSDNQPAFSNNQAFVSASVDEKGWLWVLERSWRRLCWLPPNRRMDHLYSLTESIAYHRPMVVVGSDEGIVTILDISSFVDFVYI